MCDKVERNYVADAQNWEQRVKGELESARIWSKNWGVLYNKDDGNNNQDQNYKEKIQKLQAKMQSLPVQGMVTSTQMSYTGGKPYAEWGSNYKRRTFGKFEQEYNFDDEELMNYTHPANTK
mmetsp:Transcript_9160/g.13571  ORF Transcript_9160/g.13571 Transcript_9160/m.13571 type:complete len:121 (-) Transcript_9160:1634-1996(-)